MRIRIGYELAFECPRATAFGSHALRKFLVVTDEVLETERARRVA